MEGLKVFKVGGKVVEDEKALRGFVQDFAAVEGNKILVHGGGKSVSAMSTRLGLEVKMHHGRRITDADTLEVVKMMLAGVANKNVVSLLQSHGCNALGLTGADGNLILAEKRPVKDGIDYGFVGDVVAVNDATLRQLIDHGMVPVLAAMTHNGKGQMLNTNADTIAASVAVGLAAHYDVELIYCFELPGVLKDIEDLASVIDVIDENMYNGMKDEKMISQGMIPKIDNAFDALKSGVKMVRIGAADRIGHLNTHPAEFGTKIIL